MGRLVTVVVVDRLGQRRIVRVIPVFSSFRDNHHARLRELRCKCCAFSQIVTSEMDVPKSTEMSRVLVTESERGHQWQTNPPGVDTAQKTDTVEKRY